MNIRNSIGFVLLVVAIYAFQVVDTSGIFSRQMIKLKYESEMKRFHKKEKNTCFEAALDLAKARVDSVLSGTKKLLDADTFLLLPRPVKPERPDLELSVDSLTIDPIFDRE